MVQLRRFATGFQPRNRIAPDLRWLVSCGVPKSHIFFKYWLVVLVWMAVIFSASTDSSSFQRSSRILGPIIHWLLPALSEQGVHDSIVIIRKCAHISEYAILAMLVWRAVRKPHRRDPRPWSWAMALVVALVTIAYAATDELHQAFVPSREGSLRDVLVDSAGVVLGLLFLWAVGRLRRRG
jgi:VanZ family protein